MSGSSLYTYIPLQHGEIRVLRFRRASLSADATRCSKISNGETCVRLQHEIEIHHVRLQPAVVYFALSYAWGNPNRDSRLTLGHGSVMPVTKSIEDALPFILGDVDEGFLWIDQVCINQADVEERNEQVAIMGDIYRGAAQVIVWLGLEGHAADRVDRVFRDYELSITRSTDDEVLRAAFTLSPEAHLNRRAMISMMKLPWFERAWVVQEFTLARTAVVIHGRFRWDPHTMFLVTCLFRDVGREPFSGFLDSETSYLRRNHPFQVMRNIKAVPEAFYSLVSRMTGLCKASETRDLVYAFLSLNQDPRIQILPDYLSPIQDVFTSFARATIAATGNLDILAVVPRQQGQGSQPFARIRADLPSWVPNWCGAPSSVPLFYRAGRVRFAASQDWPWTARSPEPKDQSRLQLQGTVVGKVDSISPVLSGKGSRQSLRGFVKLDEQVSALRQILRRVVSQSRLTRQRALRVCISDGSFVPHLSEPTMEQDKEFRQHEDGKLGDDQLESLLRVYDDEDHYDTWHREKWLLREYVLVLRNRRLFVAVDGRIGLAQDSLRAGDTIIIAQGSATPLVVRPTDESQRLFKFIGQCYIENAMFGEECDFETAPASTFILE